MRRVCRMALLMVALEGPFGLARADLLFNDGNAVTGLVAEAAAKLNALDAEGFAALFANRPDCLFWNRAERYLGRDEIAAGIGAVLGVGKIAQFKLAPARVLTARTETWATFDWQWGGSDGTAVLRAEVDAAAWRFSALDLYGRGLQEPFGGYDPRLAVAALNETTRLMERAADAFAKGKLVDILPLIHNDFHFYDANGRLYTQDDALFKAAFSPVPKGISKDTMTLYVSEGTGRAIAFQDVGGKRVSLLLRRDTDEWLIHTASLSERLEELSVSPTSPRGRRLTRWAALRRDGVSRR